jgi:ABC-type uncharacterized transport system ATPase subunit
MDEAERADRVVMIHEGRVVLEGAPPAIRAGIGGVSIRCPASSAVAADILRAAGLESTVHAAARIARIDDAHSSSVVPAVAARLAEAAIPFEISPPTLGDAYLAATGSSLDHASAQEAAA